MRYCLPRSDEFLLRQPASRSPEIADGYTLCFKEAHCIDEPRQFRRSCCNSTLGHGDFCRRCTGCSFKVADAIDRGVERAQLSR